MPTTHDQKPRNFGRRKKGALRHPSHVADLTSKRANQRRFLRQSLVLVHEHEFTVRLVLRSEGKNWRHYERADSHEKQRIGEVASAALMRFKQEMRTA